MDRGSSLRVALVISELTNRFWLQKTGSWMLRRKYAEWVGWKHALEEYGYPFDVIADSELEKLSNLLQYSIVILPEVSVMSDSAAENLVKFVERGGVLIISSKFGPFWHPDGTERVDRSGLPAYPPKFTDMMGVDKPPVEDLVKGGVFSYVDLGHGIYNDLSEEEVRIALAARSIGGGFNVLADSIIVSKIRTDANEVPAIVVHEYGDGMCIYFNFQIGGIVADYENDVQNEIEKDGSVAKELPRREKWTQGECYVLKQIMKNSLDYAFRKSHGCVVRVWQGVNAAKSVVILTHDVDSRYGQDSGIYNLKAEEKRRGFVSTWYFQSDSPEYSLDSNELSAMIDEGHEIGLHGTDSYENRSEMLHEKSILKSFCPPNYDVKSERQHYLRRVRLDNLDEESLPTHAYEAESGFICSSTLPAYSTTEPRKVNSGVKCYSPYYGTSWSAYHQSLVELPILILPLILQDVWIEQIFIEKLTALFKLKCLAKLWIWIFSRHFESKFLAKWIEIFDYCYRKNVTFCLLTHSDSKYEEGTGSPSRTKNLYGPFLDYILSKGRVFVTTAAKYAEWWKARREALRNLMVDSLNGKIVARISKTEKPGITLLFEMARVDSPSLTINGKKWSSYFIEENRLFVTLPQSDSSLVIEVK